MNASQSIRTERLSLRRWLEGDRRRFAEMNTDPRVMEYFPATICEDQSNDMVDRIEQHFAERGFGLWVVEINDDDLKSNMPFAGFIGLSTPRFEAHFTPCIEIGWRLAAEHWGRGYATEGAMAVLDYAFKILQLDEVVAMTAVDNQRSRRVMEKIGMTWSPDDDFDHPMLEAGHRIRRHVLYRISKLRRARICVD